MNKFCVLSIALLWAATAGAAEDFNGSRPMDCKPLQTHDCLPTQKICTPLKPEAGRDETMHVDVARMSVQTPLRTDKLPIASSGCSSHVSLLPRQVVNEREGDCGTRACSFACVS